MPELSELFRFTPPPVSDSQKPNEPEKPAQPKTWLVESILVTLFCCLPFGIIGIINSGKVESLYNKGKYAEAEMASKDAKKWISIGFWVTFILCALYFLFMIALGGTLFM